MLLMIIQKQLNYAQIMIQPTTIEQIQSGTSENLKMWWEILKQLRSLYQEALIDLDTAIELDLKYRTIFYHTRGQIKAALGDYERLQ